LSAPRGVINLGGHIYANGNYIHNNGTFAPDVTNISLHDTSTQVWSFYDLDPAARFILAKSINVENELGGASQIRMNGATSTGGATITMGTATSAGNIAVGFFGEWGNNTTTRIVAADTSGLNPWTMQSSVNLQLGIASGAFWEFANGDIQIATLTTADDYSNAKTITLTGDCEFDAVTVSSGDTLDLNGQRAEFSGALTQNGPIADTGGGGLIVCNNYDRTSSNSALDNTSMIVTGASGTHDYRSPRFGNLMFNLGSSSDEVSFGPFDGCGNLLFGSGTITTTNSNTWNATNLSIATGGTYNAGDQTLTVAGDFTTSGGLLGASCLDLEKDNKEYVRIPVNGSTNTHLQSPHTSGAMTVESWVKIESDAEMEVWHKGTDYVLAIDPSGGATKLAWADGSNYDFSNWQHTLESGQLNVGKWHHIACVRDVVGSNGRISYYIDGKLVGQVTNTSSGATWTDSDTFDLYVGRYQDSDSGAGQSYFDGNIENLRIWNVARTDAQIRESMFTAEYADGTSGLVEQFLFNEGNSHVVAGTNPTSESTYANGAGEQYTSSEQANYTGVWAASGAVDKSGGYTLTMAGTTQSINIKNGFDIYNLTVNDGSTTSIHTIDNTAGLLDVYADLIVNEKLTSHADSNTSGVRIKTSNRAVTIGSDVKTTALATLYQFVIDHGGNTNVPECNLKYVNITSGGTLTATGNHTIATELQIASGCTYNANGNTIASKFTNVLTGGSIDLRNSNMNFSVTNSGDAFTLGSNSTLLTGNTNITGNGTGSSRTHFTAPNAGGYEVVGTVKHMMVRGSATGNQSHDSDLTVIGSVIDCSFESSHANIRQWHHTLDTQQLLDADEVGDDDLRLTKPALDNALELQTR